MSISEDQKQQTLNSIRMVGRCYTISEAAEIMEALDSGTTRYSDCLQWRNCKTGTIVTIGYTYKITNQ